MAFRLHPRAIVSASLLGTLGLVAGCAVGPNYHRPDLKLPDSYTEDALHPEAKAGEGVPSERFVAGQELAGEWWKIYHSEPLDRLVKASLEHNPNLTAAQAALRAAQEDVAAQRGAFWPQVGASFAPTRQKIASTLASPASSNSYLYNLYTAQLSVSYTADVFGVNRRQVESLQAQADSQRFELEAAYLTVTSNVVTAAITEAGLRGQIRALEAIVKSQEDILRIVKEERRLGQVADADVAVQEAALATSEALLPPLRKQLAQERDLLSALVGQYPSERLEESFTLDSLDLPRDLPVSLPSSLVEHRPDVRAAEEQLHSASAQVGVAIGNRLPSVTLGVNGYGSAAYTMANLFTKGTGFWGIGADLSQTLFDGGTLSHRQGAAEAAYDEAVAQYKAAVINAFQNVADSLQAIDYDTAGLAAARRAALAADRSLEMAKKQLTLGDISPTALMVVEQNDEQAQVNLIQAEANRLEDTAALFQALGGGWWQKDLASDTAQKAGGSGSHPVGATQD